MGVGAFLCTINTALDIAYAAKAPFFTRMLYILMIVFIVLKILITMSFGGYLLKAWVYDYIPKLSEAADNYDHDEVREDGKRKTEGDSQSRTQGKTLYGSMFFIIYSGWYRLLPVKDFPFEICVCLSLEFFFHLVPTTLVQVINNSNETKLTLLQSAAVVFKVFAILIFVIELCFTLW